MMNFSDRLRNLVLLALFSSFMLILGYIEKMIPLVPAVPGIRLGLSNVVLIYALVLMNFSSAASLIFVKVVLGGILFNGPIGTMYALVGSVASLIIMYIILRFRLLSIIGMSLMGSIAHMLGQLSVAYLNIGWLAVLANIPFLLIASAISGVGIGILSKHLLKHIVKTFPQYKDKINDLGE